MTQEPEPPTQATPTVEYETICAHQRPVRLSWAKLLKRVFDLDLEHCPKCDGEMKIIAANLEQPVIEKVLTHLGLPARAHHGFQPVAKSFKRPDADQP